jgi:hypothetical protein
MGIYSWNFAHTKKNHRKQSFSSKLLICLEIELKSNDIKTFINTLCYDNVNYNIFR